MGREVREWERKAELAISKAREDLARAALTEKHNLERDTDILEGDLQELELHLTKLNEDIGQLQQKLDDAKNRHKAMVLKHDTVSNRLRTRSKLHDNRIDDALGRFEGIEEKIDQMEGKVDAFDIGKDRSLQDQFAELESEDVIDDELEKLKARLKEKSE
jgi:phage shock protein A